MFLSTLFQRWQNNVETTLKELRQFNVNETIFNVNIWLKMNVESTHVNRHHGMLIYNASMLRKQHWNNFVNIRTDVYWKLDQ